MRDVAAVVIGVAYIGAVAFGCWVAESAWPLLIIVVVDDLMASVRG